MPREQNLRSNETFPVLAVALRRHDGDVGHVSVTKIDPARSRLTPAPSETASSNWSDWSIILSRGGCHG